MRVRSDHQPPVVASHSLQIEKQLYWNIDSVLLTPSYIILSTTFLRSMSAGVDRGWILGRSVAHVYDMRGYRFLPRGVASKNGENLKVCVFTFNSTWISITTPTFRLVEDVSPLENYIKFRSPLKPTFKLKENNRIRLKYTSNLISKRARTKLPSVRLKLAGTKEDSGDPDPPSSPRGDNLFKQGRPGISPEIIKNLPSATVPSS